MVRVPPAYTTQECWFCGTPNPVPLDVRQLECHGCSRTLDWHHLAFSTPYLSLGFDLIALAATPSLSRLYAVLSIEEKTLHISSASRPSPRREP